MSTNWIEVNQLWNLTTYPTTPFHEEWERVSRSDVHLEEKDALLQVLKEQIDEWLKTPEGADWMFQYADAVEAPRFKHTLKVGMLIELSTGQRILVGDVNVDGEENDGDSHIPADTFVVRYRMIDLAD